MKINKDNIQEIYDRYGVSPKRAEHSLNVAEIAVSLAKRYQIDEESAWLAGALHDIARDWNEEDLITYARNNKITLSPDELGNYLLMHAKIGASICKKELNISNIDILKSITSHTLGKPKMNDLQMIIFLSDFIESTRLNPAFTDVVSEAELSLEHTMNLVNAAMADYIITNGKTLSQDFLENQKYYSKF